MSKYKRKPKDSKCEICGHEWIKRKEDPKLCPKCKTYKTKRGQVFTEQQKESKAEYQRKYIEINKEKRNKQIRERMRRWRADNPERARETGRRHELKSRSKRLEYKSRMRKTPRWKYLTYVDRSKAVGREMIITFEQYVAIISRPCVYCGDSSNIGMDRVDSSIGYVSSNVVPCCGWCNKMKLNHSTDDFINKCRQVVMRSDRAGADFGAAILGDMRF